MDNVILREGEWIESLQYRSLNIILSKLLPRFTTDAVILSAFCSAGAGDRVVDMGGGTGVISLLLHARTGAAITAIELHEGLCDMLERSITLNGLNDSVSSVCADLRTAYKHFNGSFDAAVCNPPYFPEGTGLSSSDGARAMSRTLTDCSLADITLAASRLLRSRGKLCMCYPAVRTVDALLELRAAGLEPKRLRFVRSRPEKPPYLVLVEAVKDAGVWLAVEDDLIIYGTNGEYTSEMKDIYHKE